jgi:hypothetical protein
MKPIVFELLILSSLVILCTSCGEPDGGEGWILTGDLFGKVETFDEFGYPLPDHSGVKVTIEGTEPLLETMTDSSGNYSFEELKTGTYHLVFSKDDF